MSDISNKGKTNINMSDQEYDKAIKEEQIKFNKWSEKFFKAKTAYEISQILSENRNTGHSNLRNYSQIFEK